MQEGLVTECPACGTRFNVSEGQLRLANGKVRCGACLTVFDARANQPGAGAQDARTQAAARTPLEPGTSDTVDTDKPLEVEEPAEAGRQPAGATPQTPGVQQWQPPAPRQDARIAPPPPASVHAPLRPLPSLSLDDLHAEPLQLEREPEPASPGAILGWTLGCLLALGLLAAQLLWFNRIEWSRQDQLAGFYDILCHQVQCDIPPRRAVERIHNLQLVVRAHPDYQDALSVHLLLENDADFEQPFPAIDLIFADIRGRPVASRRLQPSDYLAPDLNPLRMARSQPYQVNLEILDPGRRAVSYEVQLAPAQL